jgi:hypothetical protein
VQEPQDIVFKGCGPGWLFKMILSQVRHAFETVAITIVGSLAIMFIVLPAFVYYGVLELLGRDPFGIEDQLGRYHHPRDF